jgi:sugar phosphate isomerase/epimerase
VDFGLSTHLFHAERLAAAHLDEVAAAGFPAIEVFATRSHFDYHDASQAQALGVWCAHAGLRLHSLHAPITEYLRGTTWGPPLSTAAVSAAERERTLDECRRAIDVARHVPFDYLVVHLGVPDEFAPPRGDNGRDAVRSSLDVLRTAVQGTGVRLALEVIPNRLSSAEQLVMLIETEDLGICLDVGHARLQGEVTDALEAVAGYLVTTHIHDNRGKADDHLIPFEGVIDWASTLMGFQKIGYTGTLMLEVAAAAGGPTATLARAASARQRMEAVLGDDLAFQILDT